MYNGHTVLILGAGSNCQYGFPSGSELKRSMVNQALNDGMWSKPLEEIKCPDEIIKSFKKALIASPDDSIDAILSRRPTLGPAGRFMIARKIAECERHDKVFPPEGWYKDFFHMLRFDDATNVSLDLSIITFNYDRSLEYFLTHIIESALEAQGQQIAKNKMKRIKIIHVHGSLGDLEFVPYGLNGNLLDVERCYINVKVVSDADLDSFAGYTEARRVLAIAQRVFIIGFGFDPINLQRLGLEKVAGKIPIVATAKQLARKNAVLKQFGDTIRLIRSTADDAMRDFQEMILQSNIAS